MREETWEGVQMLVSSEYAVRDKDPQKTYIMELGEPETQEDFDKYGLFLRVIKGEDEASQITEYLNTKQLGDGILPALIFALRGAETRLHQVKKQLSRKTFLNMLEGLSWEPETPSPASGQWVLVDMETEMKIERGTILQTLDGMEVKVVGGYPPNTPSSTGRVCCEDKEANQFEWFPNVLNLKWQSLRG